MTDYDDLFAETAPDNSVFADKQAVDPLQQPETIRGRDDHKWQLADYLHGATEGYLLPTVTIHGPPGTGKTATTRRVCAEFAQRHNDVAVEYVNLKECRSLFSAAREIHLELTGETVEAYEGLDGAFTGVWEALVEYPEWTVLLLDESDQIAHDANYDPSEFLYRLLRGRGSSSVGSSSRRGSSATRCLGWISDWTIASRVRWVTNRCSSGRMSFARWASCYSPG